MPKLPANAVFVLAKPAGFWGKTGFADFFKNSGFGEMGGLGASAGFGPDDGLFDVAFKEATLLALEIVLPGVARGFVLLGISGVGNLGMAEELAGTF